MVAGEDHGSHLQRGADVLELQAGRDVARTGQVVTIERDLGIRDLAGDEQHRFAAVLDDREHSGRRLHAPLGAVHAHATRGARTPAIGDDDAPTPVDRIAVLRARLPEVESDPHLLAALGSGVLRRSHEEGQKERESTNRDHVFRLAPRAARGQKA